MKLRMAVASVFLACMTACAGQNPTAPSKTSEETQIVASATSASSATETPLPPTPPPTEPPTPPTQPVPPTPPRDPVPPPVPPPPPVLPTPVPPPANVVGEDCDKELLTVESTSGALGADGRVRVLKNRSTKCTMNLYHGQFMAPVAYLQPGWDTGQKIVDHKPTVLKPGETATVTMLLPTCGYTQGDVYWATKSGDIGPNGDNLLPTGSLARNVVAHWYVYVGPPCPPPPPPPPLPTCESNGLALQVTLPSPLPSGNQFTVTSKVTWTGAGAVSVEWGDGTTMSVVGTTGATVPHTYTRGETDKKYTVVAKYSGGGLTCMKSVEVTVPKLQPCSVTNPPTLTVLSSKVVQSSYSPSGLTVTVTYEYANYQNQKVAIYWVEEVGEKRRWVKQPGPINISCDGGKREHTLTWTAYDKAHLVKQEGSSQVRSTYYFLKYTGDDPTSLQDPDISFIHKITSVTTP